MSRDYIGFFLPDNGLKFLSALCALRYRGEFKDCSKAEFKSRFVNFRPKLSQSLGSLLENTHTHIHHKQTTSNLQPMKDVKNKKRN